MDSIKVRAPATTANLASGFDVCGMALQAPHDEFSFSKANDWSVKNTGRYPAASNAEKSVFASVWNAMKNNFKLDGTLAVESRKSTKPRAGMGSSATEASATSFAVNELFQLHLTKPELVHWAGFGEAFAAGEAHYDNVAPCVLGGFTITHTTTPLKIKRLDPPPLVCLLIVTDREKPSTAFARSVLPQQVDRKKALKNSVTLARLLVGFFDQDVDTVLTAFEDEIVEPARSEAGILPFLTQLKSLAKEFGFAAAASGAGPTLIAFGRKKDPAFEQAVSAFYTGKKVKTELIWTQPSELGVHRV